MVNAPAPAFRTVTLRPAASRAGADRLAEVLPRILASGSDGRIALDAGGRNGYGCRALPCPQALAFSSSTASTISARAFAAAEAAYKALFVAAADRGFASAFEAATERLREELRTLLELDACDADIVLSASGTDSGIHALHLLQAACGRALVSIVVAPEETGSGVPLAAAGRHFSNAASSGSKVTRGAAIAGMAGIDTVLVPSQDAGGARPPARIDADIRAAVARAISAGRGAVLHVMHHSKIGTRAPGAALLAELRGAHGANVQFVLDACQFRLSRRDLRAYLDAGFLVLVTGSKFFAGPPLSGATLVPASFRARLRATAVPAGLADYVTGYDWPLRFGGIRAQLPRRENLGQYLRWVAAAAEMRAYFEVPEPCRRLALTEFSQAAQSAIGGRPGLALLPAPAWCAQAGADDEFGVRSVFPFLVRVGGRYATPAESRVIYRALNDDVGGLLRCDTSLHARLAATLCHVGQPVAVRHEGMEAGALRVSADARLVSECFAGADMGEALAALRAKTAQLDIVLDKAEWLAANLEALLPFYGD